MFLMIKMNNKKVRTMRTLKESSHCSHNYTSIYIRYARAHVHYYIYKKKGE
jgi:hypothetical protein